MSRSRRKTPIFGNCGARSQKNDKREANQRHRTHERNVLKKIELDEESADDVSFDKMNEVSDVWNMAMDGKGFRSEEDAIRSQVRWDAYFEARGMDPRGHDFHEDWKKSMRK